MGATPAIPAARPQGSIPTLKMPTARGWAPGQTPVAAPGLKVNAFATGLKHPRWIHLLPNGDVTVAEALFLPGPITTLFDYAMVSTMKRAAAVGVSPNRITLLRDADGDGVAETKAAFLEGLSQPFGMALLGDTFYVGNTDGLVAFPYTTGATRLTAPGRKLTAFKPGGHWTRSLLPSPDGRKLYAGVGSLSNIADNGMEAEAGRAAIHEVDLASGSSRIFASGLRNPVGLAWEPRTGVLWTVVNEARPGRQTPPDSPRCATAALRLAPLPQRTVDDRAAGSGHGRQGPDAGRARRATRRSAPAAAGRHAARLPRGHGHRPAPTPEPQQLSGYRASSCRSRSRPAGRRAISRRGFSPRTSESYGRPVGVTIGPGGCLLVADDVGDVIWRVTTGRADALFRLHQPQRATADRRTRQPVDHDRVDRHPCLCIDGTGQRTAAIVATTPCADGQEHGHEIPSGFGNQILVARRSLAVAPFLQQAGLGQSLEAPRQDIGRNAQAGAKLIEARQAECRIAQDQHAPALAHLGQAASDGARPQRIFFGVHCIMIVTFISYCK